MDDEEETYRLWKIRKTIMQLCHDRGYLVTQDELDQTLEEFKAQFGDKPSEGRPRRTDLTVLVAHNDDPTDQMFVFFPEEPKVGIKTIKVYCQRMQEENITRALIVVQQGMTPSAKQSLVDMAPKYILEQFLQQELLINITEHELVPEHVVMTKEEVTELLARYKLRENQLPRIQAGDPVARYFGIKRGQPLGDRQMDCNHLTQAVGLLAVCPAVICSTLETYLLLLWNPRQAVCLPSWAEGPCGLTWTLSPIWDPVQMVPQEDRMLRGGQ
ncbi:PREDICTED: DNA-directed RNA polymerases I, II, and III subunit RPABC1 isoform X1 [Myotis brandtii]|uniref:DNA-directed RNA polymerases I, II, and III subunit RPABC1 isoform X1 n=2 Tax=Myotis brandtii TaxID=109478 RepID=UPI000703F779|nr:PREDICTED: DNA-directed RNA polymerases I, II, and III subunit RPABC1 isoform X1 [Myotis brandtii]